MASKRVQHRPSKRLGQNFLVEENLADEIVSSISPGHQDSVLEPGPGHGTLTRQLVNKAGRVIVIEKDPVLVRELEETFHDQSNLTILQGDILKMGDSLPEFNKLVSTPPYYISSRLILLLTNKKFDVAAIVFQKEFGDRLLAEPGNANYGRLTVMARRKLDIEKVRDISRMAFSPRPKVDSSLLKFTRKQRIAEIDEPLFEELVRGIFTQRRRLLKGALAHFLALKYGREAGKRLMRRMTISDERVYQLSIGQLESLSLQLLRVVSDALVSGELNG